MKKFPVAGLVLLLIAACNTDEAKNPADEYAGRFATAVCGQLQPCCTANGLGFDRGNCELGGVGFVQSGVDQARRLGATFDTAAADACVAGAERLARTCESTRADPAVSTACASVFVGTRKPGDTCTRDVECAGGPSSRGGCYGAEADGNKEGTCVELTRPAAPGDRCGVATGELPPSLADCAASDLQCDFLSLICKPLTEVGAPCPGLTVCVPTAYCGEDKLCTAKLAGGATCKANASCTSGACIRGTCAANGLGTPTPCTGEKE